MTTFTTSIGGDDDLTGTDGADKIIAGGGDDTVDGGAGSDTINAGGGNDTIIYDEADYKILGGGGIDTLWFTGSNQHLNLSENFVNGIEKLLLDGGGGHQVTFTASDIVRVSDTDQMIITGDSSNHIDLGTGWTFDGLTADGESQILVNGLAKLIVALPIDVEGFSKNAVIEVSPLPELMQEDGLLHCEGTITVTGANAGQGLLIGQPIATDSHLGSLTVSLLPDASTDGSAVYSYEYSISNDLVQSLGMNEWLNEKFQVQSIDGQLEFLEFTINGKNDRPIFVDPNSALINLPIIQELPSSDPDAESEELRYVSGTYYVKDVDANDELILVSPTVDSVGTFGNITLSLSPKDVDGAYAVNWEFSYTDSALAEIQEGSIRSVTSQILVSDTVSTALRTQLVFKFLGSNDIPIIGDPPDATVDENPDPHADDTLTATGIFSISDRDYNQNSFQTSVIASEDNLGTLSIETDGSYVYSVSNADVRYLEAGESETDTFTITSVDGTTKDVTFTINGADSIIRGTAGNDTLTGTELSDSIFGLGGNDTIDAGAGNDSINLIEGLSILGTARQAGVVHGGSDDDTIIFFGNSAPILDLYGDDGKDVFILKFLSSSEESGVTIKDFESGLDEIRLPSNRTYEFSQTSQPDTVQIFTVGGGEFHGILTVTGVSLTETSLMSSITYGS